MWSLVLWYVKLYLIYCKGYRNFSGTLTSSHQTVVIKMTLATHRDICWIFRSNYSEPRVLTTNACLSNWRFLTVIENPSHWFLNDLTFWLIWKSNLFLSAIFCRDRLLNFKVQRVVLLECMGNRIVSVLCFYRHIVKTWLTLGVVEHDVQFGGYFKFCLGKRMIVKCAMFNLFPLKICIHQLTLFVIVELILK